MYEVLDEHGILADPLHDFREEILETKSVAQRVVHFVLCMKHFNYKLDDEI